MTKSGLECGCFWLIWGPRGGLESSGRMEGRSRGGVALGSLLLLLLQRSWGPFEAGGIGFGRAQAGNLFHSRNRAAWGQGSQTGRTSRAGTHSLLAPSFPPPRESSYLCLFLPWLKAGLATTQAWAQAVLSFWLTQGWVNSVTGSKIMWRVQEGKVKHVFSLQGIFSFTHLISNHQPVQGGKDGYISTLHVKKCNHSRLNDYRGLSVE